MNVTSPADTRARPATVMLLWLSGLSTLLAAVVAATGGFTIAIFGIEISVHSVLRPTVAAVASGFLAFASLGGGDSTRGLAEISAAVVRYARWIVFAYAAAIAVATYSTGAQVAGGFDSSGYLSQARLWRTGKLRIETPLAHELRFSVGQYAFTPGGFQPAMPGEAVASYPPGLPLMFAAAGERGQFFVVPLCAAAIVLMAFAIGRRLGGVETALIAAAGAGASPILLFQAAQPMSDVPAAFWWTLAIWLLIVDSSVSVAAAGLAAAGACLVRPNLFAIAPLLAILMVWWSGWSRTSIVRAIVLMTPVALAAAAFIYLQRTLFGGATTTGYGPFGSLFAVENVWKNLARYPRWMFVAQSGLIAISLAAPIAIGRGWVTPAIDRRRAARIAWAGLMLFAALQVLYLLYLVFDGWVFFRFLLPAMPLLLVLQAVVLAGVARLAPPPLRGLAAFALAVLVASWGVGRARNLGAFRLHDSEQRYLDVAEFTHRLPPDAVFVTLQYAGSLWYYRSAPILRSDWIDPIEIDQAIQQLAARGRRVYAVVDDWELQPLRERFTGTSFVTRLAIPLFEAGESIGIKVRIYDVTGTTAVAGVR